MTVPETQAFALEIKRLIKAPRERIYAAWTDPAQLKEWFGPEGVQTHQLIADVRPGGQFRWDVSNPDGERMTMRGEYRELVPGRKVAFTWQWEDDEAWSNQTSLVTIDLSDGEGGTEICLRHEKLPSEDSRDRHAEGWSSALNKLAEWISNS